MDARRVDKFSRRVGGDALVGALIALAFVVFLIVGVPRLDGSADDPTDLGAGILVLVTLPAWYAAWALLLRARRAPAWWAAPIVAATPGLLYAGSLDATTGNDLPGAIFFVAIVAGVAGLWAWICEQVRPRD